MQKTRYTISTSGSRTVVRKTSSGRFTLARGTSSPPYEEIKHLLSKPASAKRSKDKKKSR